MTITYEDGYIEELLTDLCDVANSRNILQKRIGRNKALVVKKRKGQMEAAPNYKSYLDYHIGNPHLLKGDLAGLYGIDINAHTRLIIKPVAEDLSAESLAKCDTVVLIGLVEYHGGKNEWLIP